MAKATYQTLIEISAKCTQCEDSCYARNAQAWAHHHARKTGHSVYVSPIFRVKPSQRALFDSPSAGDD